MADDRTGNRILDSLPDGEFPTVLSCLEAVTLSQRDVLYRTGERIERVYFPTGGVLSILAVMRDGNSVEVVTVGLEGMSGAQLTFDSDRPLSEMVCQVAGTARAMTTESFYECFERLPGFRRLAFAYMESQYNFMAQSIACNRLHSLHERCARWLLSTRDRVGSNQFYLTQEFLAVMLGTSRPAVTVVAGALQEAGLISYHRGRVTICEPERLERESCECYEVTSRQITKIAAQRRDGAITSSS